MSQAQKDAARISAIWKEKGDAAAASAFASIAIEQDLTTSEQVMLRALVKEPT